MTDSSRPKRPVVGSRNPTSRPRKVAGQRGDEAGPEFAPQVPSGTPAGPPPPEEPPVADQPGPEPEPGHEPVHPGRRRTLALVAAAVALVLVAAAEGFYLWADDDAVPSADRPVVTGEIAHRGAVEAAAQAADEIVSTSWKDYDAQVDQAVSTMTDEFAEKYRQTAEDIQARIVSSKTEVQVEVAATGVVRASSEQVQALLFLNQYVTKDGQDTAFTPYRALVTVVHTDGGWLVSDIETK